jgi:glycosyltransferase involved in cell wall biosynthesis
MRVAIIHPFLFRYARGIERFTFNLTNALSASGVEMHLMTWRWRESIQIDALDPRVCVHAFPTSRYFAAKAIVPFYVVHLLRHSYDFVWIYFASYGEAEALNLVRWQRFGIVFHYPYVQVPYRYREFQRAGLDRRAARVASVSQFVADGVRESLGRESEVIHHGVDTQHFAPDPAARSRIRELLSLSADAPLLVTAAALEERKGMQWVLRALPKILCEFPETVYIVLGEGSYRTALEHTVREFGVEDHVRFLGSQADVVPFYQAADVSLILSNGEASSLAALESLACGIPVIAARQPPFDELIESSSGMLVNEMDTSQISQAVIALLGDPARCRAMGAAGRKFVFEKYAWARTAGKLIKVCMENMR